MASAMATGTWNMATGAMEWLLLWLLVLWSGFFYGYWCYGVPSAMATGAWNIAAGAMEQLLL